MLKLVTTADRWGASGQASKTNVTRAARNFRESFRRGCKTDSYYAKVDWGEDWHDSQECSSVVSEQVRGMTGCDWSMR